MRSTVCPDHESAKQRLSNALVDSPMEVDMSSPMLLEAAYRNEAISKIKPHDNHHEPVIDKPDQVKPSRTSRKSDSTSIREHRRKTLSNNLDPQASAAGNGDELADSGITRRKARTAHSSKHRSAKRTVAPALVAGQGVYKITDADRKG